ncbi:early transcribed membrane protein 10.2 [Plasmodium reichenowi]|uniref:Early transcribed membrane protein 10.2 n=1 Tax=Plasmodium reichenowi TaxID=5854 RepID=D3JXV2_PLARE|nr:early transcribed membrane protein 10.2 [Plasmodium reichenowi]CDO64762.1 early transcribed membrane protein 10.2 [Plasmodium reichenowi]
MKVGKLFFLLNILVVCHFIISCLCRTGQTTRGNLLALKAIEQDLQQKKKRKRNLILYSLGSAALIAALVVTGIGLNMYMKKKKDDSDVQEIIDEKDEKVKEKPAEKKKSTVKIVSKRVPVKSKSSHGKSKARTVNSEVSPKLSDEKKEDLLKFSDKDLLLAAESLKELKPKYDENTQGSDFFKNINEPRKLASFSLYDALDDASEQNQNKDAESSTGPIPTPTESSLGILDGKKDTSTDYMDPLNPDGSFKSDSSEDKPTSESEGTTPESNFDSKTPQIKEIDEPFIVPSYYPTTGPNPNTHGPPSRRTSTSRSYGSSNRSSSGTSTRSKSRSNPLRDSSGISSGRSTTPRVRKE